MFDFTQPAYLALRNIVAERTNRIIAWVGSGLSSSIGFPTWQELKNELCESLHKKAQLLESEERIYLETIHKSIVQDKNHWNAFGMLREHLGKTSFVSLVRERLSPTHLTAVPKLYKEIWRLPLAGILNLNLDRLATQAFNEIGEGRGRLSEFCGFDSGPHVYLLQAANPFVANLHGTCENAENWVMTRADISRLLHNQGYQAFVRSALASYTLVLLGLSAEDIAVGGHFEQLIKKKIDTGQHFWITSRNERASIDWAERVGIRTILYSADGNHKELEAVINDLIAHKSIDDPAPPVRPELVAKAENLPEPHELNAQTSEQIRNVLNMHAAKLLKKDSEDSNREYIEFCQKYEEAIYRSWYVSQNEKNNIFFGYKIFGIPKTGGFGRVFRAEGPDGKYVAIKLLHEEIRSNTKMLQSFRRGVQSMRILSARGVAGMVPHIHAWEIPAAVVMEYVDGIDLEEAAKTKTLKDWTSIVRIGRDLAQIIYSAHSLPERVLHRDIRPSNVMLKDWIEDDLNGGEVVVLDFDLSWHRDAYGQSIEQPNSASGFLAPEQVDRNRKDSTRNALVDSFGLGMTLLFMRTGKTPLFGQSRFKDWEDFLEREVASRVYAPWRSLPKRYARIIYHATMDRQRDRWDVGQMLGELTRLYQIIEEPKLVVSAELLAEELVSNCSAISGTYKWKQDSNSAEARLPSGVIALVTGDESNGEITLSIRWIYDGNQDRRKVGKYIPTKCDKASSLLQSSGWKVTRNCKDVSNVELCAEASVASVREDLFVLAKGLNNAIGCFLLE